MGNKTTISKWVVEQFDLLLDAKKKLSPNNPQAYQVKEPGHKNSGKYFLTLADMQKVKKYPNKDYQLDLSHLGTLFMIDKSKEGRFYQDEIIDFAHFYCERQATNPNTVDVVKEFQGYCTAQLWNYVTQQEGKKEFIRWFANLFSHGNLVPLKDLGKEKNIDKTDKTGAPKQPRYVYRGAVQGIHSVLNISKSYAFQQEQTFTLLHNVANQKKMNNYNRTDILPVEIFEMFAEEFINGFIKYMTELGFEPGMDLH